MKPQLQGSCCQVAKSQPRIFHGLWSRINNSDTLRPIIELAECLAQIEQIIRQQIGLKFLRRLLKDLSKSVQLLGQPYLSRVLEHNHGICWKFRGKHTGFTENALNARI